MVHCLPAISGLAKSGHVQQDAQAMHVKLNEQGLIDLDNWCIDSMAVKATRASSGAGKKGGRKNQRTTRLVEVGQG
jgi:hypothetical protein